MNVINKNIMVWKSKTWNPSCAFTGLSRYHHGQITLTELSFRCNLISPDIYWDLKGSGLSSYRHVARKLNAKRIVLHFQISSLRYKEWYFLQSCLFRWKVPEVDPGFTDSRRKPTVVTINGTVCFNCTSGIWVETVWTLFRQWLKLRSHSLVSLLLFF